MPHSNMLNLETKELQCINKYFRRNNDFFLNYQEQLGKQHCFPDNLGHGSRSGLGFSPKS